VPVLAVQTWKARVKFALIALLNGVIGLNAAVVQDPFHNTYLWKLLEPVLLVQNLQRTLKNASTAS